MRFREPAWVIAPIALVCLAASQGEHTPLHGAASTDEQKARAQALIGELDPGRSPLAVDAARWRASIPADNPLKADVVALGRDLYFEKALSQDGTVACATCHDVTRSFTDRRAVSEGIHDQLGRRNAPTTMNAALLITQFWDGRSPTLEDQAKQPVLNTVEMGQPNEEAAVASLKKAGYDDRFQKVFGKPVNYADMSRAIASFERTLIFMDTPFDAYVAGDDKAISASAKRGIALFNGKGRCVACHPVNDSNPLGSDGRFHNVGVSARTQNFEELAKQARAALAEDSSKKRLDDLAVATNLSELGRFMVTKSYADIGSFRTPQLRNVGITGPYMHDGSLTTLWDVMDHYNKGGEANPYLDGGIEPLALSESEIDDLVAFMFTLTDKHFADVNSKELSEQGKRAKTTRPFRDNDLANRKVIQFEQRVIKKDGAK